VRDSEECTLNFWRNEVQTMSARIQGLNAVSPEIIQMGKRIEDSIGLPRRRDVLRSVWCSYVHRKADVSFFSSSKKLLSVRNVCKSADVQSDVSLLFFLLKMWKCGVLEMVSSIEKGLSRSCRRGKL